MSKTMEELRELSRRWAAEAKTVEKILRKLFAEAKSSRILAKKRLDEVHNREVQIAELQKEVKEWKKRLEAVPKEPPPLKTPEKEIQLQSALHSLARELRKKEHDFEQLKRKSEKTSELESELEKNRLTIYLAEAEKRQSEERQKEMESEADRLRERIRILKEAKKPSPPYKPPAGTERLGIFVDIQNIYHTTRDNFGGRRIDFGDLVSFLKKKGFKVEVYGVDKTTALDLKKAADLFVPINPDWLLK